MLNAGSNTRNKPIH